MESYNEVVDREVPPLQRKGYSLRNPPNVNYINIRATRISMGWNNLIVGSNEIHSFAKSYINVINDITTFVKPTRPTTSITNKTILTQYSIKQGLKIFLNKGETAVQKINTAVS